MFELRPYQKPITEKVFDYMRKHKGKHPLIALPTGSGKTIVMADIIKTAIENWPDTKVLVLSHVKEILKQDYDSIRKHTGLRIGLNSAGFKRREAKQVTVAGIQSVFRRAYEFKDYNLVIIDECHLIPYEDSSMYRTFFADLKNPRYLGLTATPFRLGTGVLYKSNDQDEEEREKRIFDDLILDLTSGDDFNKLIEDGYLCELTSQAAENTLDTDGVGIRRGDFDEREMSEKFDKDSITDIAVKELILRGRGRKKWLIFAIDISHAEHIAERINACGIPAMVVHSKMEFDRDYVIKCFRQGKFRAIVNVNVLTTGFDDPEIDLIGLLRPTQSPVIHVQTIGRGLRIAPGKQDCLVLDFAGNTERLGPINAITLDNVNSSKRDKGEGEAPVKKCEGFIKTENDEGTVVHIPCNTLCPISQKFCPTCGNEFHFITKLTSKPTLKSVVNKKKQVQWYDVKDVFYDIHKKSFKPDMVKVSYQSGLTFFTEYVCIQHPGYAGYKAQHWVNYRGGEATTAIELLNEAGTLKKPSRIKVDTRGKYPLIVDFEFDDKMNL